MHWNVPPDVLPGSATFVRVLDCLSHAEKESGFWFHTYVTYSDTGTMNVIISDGAITV